jgi:hypothetical protein
MSPSSTTRTHVLNKIQVEDRDGRRRHEQETPTTMQERAMANGATDPKRPAGPNEREVKGCFEIMSGALWVRDELIAGGRRSTPNDDTFSFELWLFAALVLVGFDFGAMLSWNLSIDQVTYLVIGSAACVFAGIVWRHGIISYYHREGFGQSPVTEVTEAPLPREVLAPALLLIAVGFILAGTPTGVGNGLSGLAHGAVMLYRFGKEGVEVILSATAWVAILTGYVLCIVRRDRSLIAFMTVLTALLALGGGILYLSYRWAPDQYREYWNDYLEPFRYVAGLFS